MIPSPILEAHGLSKVYRLGRIGASTLWEDARALFGGQPVEKNRLWALDDVSFRVERGEVLAIVGANGAGKSTLLKLLARISEPTRGRAVVRGRLASLLEVGTGFHADSTGRDNIFLSGAVLGMKRAEIRARFKKIVEFAGVEEFLDTPVKRYSSGMYLRLAFAVAAHLDAEILLMDEVLAVGDAAFQQRSLGKMQDLARDGRAVLLVSHQLQAIQTIASRAILLEKGKLTAEGAPAAVVARYLGQQGGAMDLTRTVDTSRLEGWFTDLKIGAGSSQSMQGVAQGEPWTLEFGVETKTAVARGNVCVSVWNASGQELFSHNWIEGQPELELAPGRHRFGLKIPTANLMPGPYWVSLHLAREQSRWICEARGLGLPPVLPGPKTDPLIESRRWGVVYIPCQWEKRA